MHDSPCLKSSDSDESKQAEEHETDKANCSQQNMMEDEQINFKDTPFQIPPSFSRSIMEETLWDDDHPYVFWVSLQLPIPLNPTNPMAAVYDALKDFVAHMAEEDPQFVIFPYHLSNHESIKDLPPPIETTDDLPDNIDEWLDYFPQAKLCVTGSDTYMALLIGLSILLPKLVKNLSTWMRNKQFGIWKAYLQSEQPTSLGWLLFSTQMMDVELLREAILEAIKNIPVGLRWKTISHGSQGAIPKDQQVKALHVLVDKLDVNMAKPLLMALYTSNPKVDHQFPFHIRMRLVPEMDVVLNTKGRQQVDKLHTCQNTWQSGKLVQIKTWEIKLLDDKSEELGGMILHDAMMDLRHPTNKKFNLFHMIDKHFRDKCHVLMVLKSAKSQAHAMITAMLPYLLWQHAKSALGPKASALNKWFKPAA